MGHVKFPQVRLKRDFGPILTLLAPGDDRISFLPHVIRKHLQENKETINTDFYIDEPRYNFQSLKHFIESQQNVLFLMKH